MIQMSRCKTFFILFALLIVAQTAWSQSQVDFYTTPTSGPGLWCRYNNGATGNSVTIGKSLLGSSGGYINTDGYPSDSVLVIPDSVTYNGHTYAVTAIGDNAFTNCGFLTSVTIPSTVTSIGDYAFSSCTGLTSMTIANENKVTLIQN